VEGEPRGEVQETVAQPRRFAAGELALEQERLGPGDQVVGCQHELEPDRVHLEVAEGEVLEAGVLIVADVVLDAGALAMAALQGGDVGLGLVGQEDPEAVAVVIGEGELRAGVGALAADDQARALRPVGQIDQVGDLGHRRPRAARPRWSAPEPRSPLP